MMQAANPTVSVVAWYGAIVSTFGFSLALYVALRDRQRLKITLRANMLDSSRPSDERFIVVNVANVGRRPVTVTLVGVRQRKKAGIFIINDSHLGGPKEITEGKSISFSGLQSGIPLANLDQVLVRDATGRTWKRRVSRAVRKSGVRAAAD